MKLPLFPLETVIFPGQELKAHVFERRFRQLAHECWQNEVSFGVPTLLGTQISVYAAEVQIKEVTHLHGDGSMDVLLQGKSVLRVEKYEECAEGRLYPEGLVTRIEDPSLWKAGVEEDLLGYFNQLNNLLNRKISEADLTGPCVSYRIGHKIGFSLKQKIKLLSIVGERDRQKLILQYLEEVVPILQTVVGKSRDAEKKTA